MQIKIKNSESRLIFSNSGTFDGDDDDDRDDTMMALFAS